MNDHIAHKQYSTANHDQSDDMTMPLCAVGVSDCGFLKIISSINTHSNDQYTVKGWRAGQYLPVDMPIKCLFVVIFIWTEN